MLNEKLYRETFDKLRASPGTRRKIMQMAEKKHAPKRFLRTALIAAAVAAALCVTAGAAYQYYVRQNVPVDQDQTVQGIAGGGQPSWNAERTYDEFGKTEHSWYNRQTVPANPDQALALLGDCLPESGYQWQIEDYTLTVEGYVLDEHTGTAKFYYTVEHPGGFGEGAVDWQHGLLNWDKIKPSVTFKTKSEVRDGWDSFGGRDYVDTARSTEEKLCIASSGANFETWKAADGFTVIFRVQGDVHTIDGNTIRDPLELEAELELPGVKSLPNLTLTDPATGKSVLLSAIGLKLDCEDMDQVGKITVEFADGTQYVVQDRAGGLDNSDYGLGAGERPEMTLYMVFNRLVDVDQVSAVTVDGTRYEVD